MTASTLFLPTWPRSLPGWAAIVSALAVLALLAMFLLVVRGAVAQGHLRRAATVADDAARRECGRLRDPHTRLACRRLVDAAVPPDAARPRR